MPITRLVTHSGVFHADEVCAYTILSDLHPHAELERTRDPARIAADPSTTIVFDVGGVYDPAAGRFDHHQSDSPRRPDGLAYASFGLVWEHAGRDWLAGHHKLPADLIEPVHAGMAAGMVRAVDQVDVQAVPPGVHVPATLSGIVFAMNPSPGWDGAERIDEAQRTEGFRQAAGFVRGVLQREVHQQARAAVAGLALEDALARSTDPRVAVLETHVPWQQAGSALRAAPQLLAVVAPGVEPGEWCITAAPQDGDGFARRRLFPSSWHGLRGDALTAAGGPAGVHFCHKDGFFAATKSKDDAIGFAQQALAAWDREDKRSNLLARAREMVGNRPQPLHQPPKHPAQAGR
jgi:uncharacterized UPF0160 family protein